MKGAPSASARRAGTGFNSTPGLRFRLGIPRGKATPLLSPQRFRVKDGSHPHFPLSPYLIFF